MLACVGSILRFERSRVFVTETARRRVVLHGRHAEIDEERIGASQAVRRKYLGEGAEVAVNGDDLVGPEAGGAKPGLGPGQFERIDIQADQATAGSDPAQDRAGMSSAAQRAVDDDVPGLGPEVLEDLRHHDRPMRVYFGRAIDHSTVEPIAVALPAMASSLIVPFMS